MVVGAVLILSLYDTGPRIKGRRITEGMFALDLFRPLPWNGSLVAGNAKILMSDEDGGLSVLDPRTRRAVQLMPNRTMVIRLKSLKNLLQSRTIIDTS